MRGLMAIIYMLFGIRALRPDWFVHLSILVGNSAGSVCFGLLIIFSLVNKLFEKHLPFCLHFS